MNSVGMTRTVDGMVQAVNIITHMQLVLGAAIDNVVGREASLAVFEEANRIEEALAAGKVLVQNMETQKWKMADDVPGETTMTVGEVPSNG